ncbi:Proteasome assembly chaperone 2 [Smittium culicis]|uniref:Proteasome assembly chaperone 2 n=1 Tax=Smittium culicis TaxID=133412 RepID=A0A1R1Y5C1_9FUNG|nr:Proteasome assembly chaperone 2 [Smittium culicis]
MKVIDLSSTDSHTKITELFKAIGLPITSAEVFSVSKDLSLGFDKLRVSNNRSSPSPINTPAQTAYHNATQDLYNSGILKQLIKILISENISASVILNFVNEGDNVPEAIQLASLLNSGLHILPPGTSGKNF